MRKNLVSLCLALSLCLPAAAQFTGNGNAPHSVKWMQFETERYRFIFPRECDSLARVFAAKMERAAPVVGNTAGFEPNQNWKKRMDVLLHTRTAYANGFVFWTPRRVELYTVPSAYAPLGTPSIDHLVLHESRHVAQMQYVRNTWMKAFSYITGELFAGGAAALYCGPSFFEGDAVVAETALSNSGRGRSADFLEYWRVSADEGKTRNYWQWRWGSLNRYTPDYYTTGYVTMAGLRTIYGEPDFTRRYYERLGKHFFPFFNFQKTVKEVSGKRFRDAFGEITATLDSSWRAGREARAPFIASDTLSAVPKWYTEYNGTTAGDGCLYSIRKGIAENRSLIRISPDGKEKRLSAFSSHASRLRYDPVFKRLWWSEYEPDLRWEQKSSSSIRFMDAAGRVGQICRGIKAYNPAPSPDGLLVAVTVYPDTGGSAVWLLSTQSGEIEYNIPFPDSLQVVETAWAGDELFASAVSEGGYGIYSLPDFSAVLTPSNVNVKQLDSRGEKIIFCSDLSGVNELYELNPSDKKCCRLTSTRNGASEFCFLGDTLYFSVPGTGGRLIHKTSSDRLLCEDADFSSPHHYEMADALSAGEPVQLCDTLPVVSGKATRYTRLGHLLRPHSWIPFYVDYNAVETQSLENLASSAGLGATVFFQNTLGDFTAIAGYHANPVGGKWWHSGHIKLTYSGLYPVFELNADIGDRNVLSYRQETDEEGKRSIKPETLNLPYVDAGLVCRVPLSRTALGLTFGAIPQLSWNISNDRFENVPLNRLTAGFRAYVITPTPHSCIYPTWGIGLNAGYSTRPFLGEHFKSNAYVMVYGYVPGFWKTHGIRLSAITEAKTGQGMWVEAYASTSPRGLPGTASAMAGFTRQGKVSFDYAFPFAALDWSLGPVTYVRNLEFYLQADWSWYKGKSLSGSLASIGGTFDVVLGNLLWLPYDTRLGLCAYWNTGNLMETLQGQKPYFVGLVFNVAL